MPPIARPCRGLLRAALTAGLATLAAAPALAQPPSSDPIDDLLHGKTAPQSKPEGPPLPTQPIYLDETGRSPDGPPSPTDLAYDTRLKASMASAEAFQGPLQGGWTLSAEGRELYSLQFVDENGWIQGAWRDLRRAGESDSSGFVDEAQRTLAGLRLRFAGGVATLRPSGEGRWTGDLIVDGQSQAVSLRRRSP